MSKKPRNTETVVESNDTTIDYSLLTPTTMETTETTNETVVEGNTVLKTGETPEKIDVLGMISSMGSKSKVIRKLSADGMATKDIVKLFREAGVKSSNGNPFIYQHARNVLNQPVKKS